MDNAAMERWQSHFDQWLQPFWTTATPGLCFEVYRCGRRVGSYQGGDSYPFYDLASLTKVLFTVPAMMLAKVRGQWDYDSSVAQYLEWWPHKDMKIVELLTHTSGLIWWKPFYKDLVFESGISQRWQRLRQDLQTSSLEPSIKAVYSDVGFLTLAFLMERLWAQPLAQIWQEVQAEFASDSQLHWIRPGAALHPKEHYAPTEDCPWRGYRIQAEVHDENAWALGGLSSHAGLFGACADVAKVFLSFRRAYQEVSHPYHQTVRFFLRRQIPKERGDWALGLMLPTIGGSSSGQYFSEHSVGHTGFTGTSVWWNPESDILIVILSNRVYYGREKREFAKLRPLLHDEIISLLRRDERIMGC